MSTITVSTRTHDRITDLARAWGISDDAVITRLLESWKAAGAAASDSQVPVHAIYRDERAEGVYNTDTGRIDLTSGPANATGLKPSPAAGEVIRAVNAARGKTVRGSRNGWQFWIITATGEALQTIRPRRAGAA
jgi:hypothetical protein